MLSTKMYDVRRAEVRPVKLVRMYTCLQQATTLMQQSVLLRCVDLDKLYIFSPVVICNYAVEIGSGMSSPVMKRYWFRARRSSVRMYLQVRDVEIDQVWRDIIKQRVFEFDPVNQVSVSIADHTTWISILQE